MTFKIYFIISDWISSFDTLQVYSVCKSKFQTCPNKGCWNSYLKLLSAPEKICNSECRFQLDENLLVNLLLLCFRFNHETYCDSARTTVRMLESLIRLAQGMLLRFIHNPRQESFSLKKFSLTRILFWYFQFCSSCKTNVQKRGHTVRCNNGHSLHWIIHDYLSYCGQCRECSTLEFYREPWHGVYPFNFLIIYLFIAFKIFLIFLTYAIESFSS